MVQLHQSLQSCRCVALCGPPQSGKTTTYKTLAAAYRHLTSDRGGNQREFPLINMTVLNTAAYTAEQVGVACTTGGLGQRMFYYTAIWKFPEEWPMERWYSDKIVQPAA